MTHPRFASRIARRTRYTRAAHTYTRPDPHPRDMMSKSFARTAPPSTPLDVWFEGQAEPSSRAPRRWKQSSTWEGLPRDPEQGHHRSTIRMLRARPQPPRRQPRWESSSTKCPTIANALGADRSENYCNDQRFRSFRADTGLIPSNPMAMRRRRYCNYQLMARHSPDLGPRSATIGLESHVRRTDGHHRRP